jgi:radical SAM-linked protein
VDARSEPAKAAAPEPRQRWRLVVSRAPDAPRLPQRETIDAWESAIDSCGLPAARTTASPVRPRITFGAPLAVGMAAEAELMDLFLTERLPRWEVRNALEAHVPVGWSLVDLADVWLGGPALAAAIAAADYRITLEADGPIDGSVLAAACQALLGASTLPREREKGGANVAYDLRPLVADVAVADVGPPAVIRVRTRFHPALGTGRPEEVVASVGDQLGRSLTATEIVRERVVLADEMTEAP